MTDTTNFRLARINKLLDELSYEVVRGMMERDIDEHLQYHFIVPTSHNIRNGIVVCRFETRPAPSGHYHVEPLPPRLRIVGSAEEGK